MYAPLTVHAFFSVNDAFFIGSFDRYAGRLENHGLDTLLGKAFLDRFNAVFLIQGIAGRMPAPEFGANLLRFRIMGLIMGTRWEMPVFAFTLIWTPAGIHLFLSDRMAESLLLCLQAQPARSI